MSGVLPVRTDADVIAVDREESSRTPPVARSPIAASTLAVLRLALRRQCRLGKLVSRQPSALNASRHGKFWRRIPVADTQDTTSRSTRATPATTARPSPILQAIAERDEGKKFAVIFAGPCWLAAPPSGAAGYRVTIFEASVNPAV